MRMPAVEPRELQNELWVDVTPDGNLAVRLLETYRARCDTHWLVVGVEEGEALIYDRFNANQRCRAAELDWAIDVLRKH